VLVGDTILSMNYCLDLLISDRPLSTTANQTAIAPPTPTQARRPMTEALACLRKARIAYH